MTQPEFDPIIDGLSDAHKLAAWLVSHNARLDTGKCGGLVATELIADATSGTHQWHIPLSGGIDMVNLDDGWFATESPADIRVTSMRDDKDALVEVRYHSIDDETRSTWVNPEAAATYEPVIEIPNN